MILGQTYDEQLFKSDMFRLFINTFADSQNGIINYYKESCNLSYTQSTITVADGVFLLQGGMIQVQGNETIQVDLDNSFCILVFEIDLTKQNTETEFNQGKFKILKGTNSSYPSLQQDDIVNNSTGIYQMEFARFVANAGGISNFADKRTFIDFTTMFENLNTQIDQILQGTNAQVGEIIQNTNTQVGQVVENANTQVEQLLQETNTETSNLLQNLNEQATQLISQLQQAIQDAGNLPIDMDEYDSSDSDGNTFKLIFRRQGSIVSLHIKCILMSGAFGQRIKSQLGFPDNAIPEKYKPRETIDAKSNYITSSGTSNVALAYATVLLSEASCVVSYCNKDSWNQSIDINLMYFGKEIQ